jgi:hypothetical protein
MNPALLAELKLYKEIHDAEVERVARVLNNWNKEATE